MGVFALKPAPLQIQALIYPSSAGTSEFMDFIVADKIVAPNLSYVSEKVLYM